jgi:hypothetical protein
VNAKAAVRWRIIAASMAGTSHLEKGLPCQDAHSFRVLPGGELLAAVSDGAGSAERSQEGACLAVKEALDGLEALLLGGAPCDEVGWQVAITGMFDEIHQKLVDFADAAGTPLRAFAVTLTCALVTIDWLVVGQIGDGAAIAEDTEGALFLTSRPQRGEYANEAFFLTLPDATRYTTVVAARRPVRALALTSDGLLRLALKLPGYEPHLKFFRPLLTFVRETADETQAQADLADFLASERVCVRTDDDKTLLLAVRTESGEPNEQVNRRKRRRRKGDRL